MRDPARIDRILELVEKIWRNSPDFRLTQLIMNALNITYDPYYIEDNELEEALKSFCNNYVKE